MLVEIAGFVVSTIVAGMLAVTVIGVAHHLYTLDWKAYKEDRNKRRAEKLLNKRR